MKTSYENLPWYKKIFTKKPFKTEFLGKLDYWLTIEGSRTTKKAKQLIILKDFDPESGYIHRIYSKFPSAEFDVQVYNLTKEFVLCGPVNYYDF